MGMGTAAVLLAAAAASPAALSISIRPPAPWVAATGSGQEISADVVVRNDGDTLLTVTSFEISLFDHDRRIFHRTIDASGTAPAIETLPHREIAAHHARLIFNPVQAVPPELTFDRVAFAVDASGGGHVQHAEAVAALRRYTRRTRYILPVRRRLLVRSRYDVLSHHRRFDYFHPMAEALHFSANFMRYAYDLFVVDSSGEAARGDGRRSEDWFGYGEPVYAPGDGIVVEAVATYSDDFGGQRLSMESVAEDPMLFYGNRVVIDHGHGEFSLLAHLRPGHVAVMPGERVRRGMQVGEIGVSGSGEEPHLHFELRSGPGQSDEGIPAYFVDYALTAGAGRERRVGRGMPVTGTFIRSLAAGYRSSGAGR